jgi:hypothetical protein
MRAAYEKHFTVPTSVGSATLIISADGTIALSAAPVAGTAVYLDGIHWDV